ncbi:MULTISPECIES: TetR/AcrR family transcriptional regulator [Rhodococcus]|uniref:TetR/AcrR family transcriptional regulator n=1 Tax=Rhodococcus TaxID=1827 RepID=UPI0002FA1CE3|nr:MULTISPECIES: TetR/AcrR family transcriptional regulator [Rhodococcus]MCT7293625.1 TetR/AcrR family transcriptional regulator [Rhodococcus sp. PAE-6]USI90140.1 TetR/AcrR family transcriptional regulator [Rhodococcus pyridinivorans]
MIPADVLEGEPVPQQTLCVSNVQDHARARRKDAGGERRNQLLSAAAECFDEVGVGAVTVEMIAARAHTSRPTFYAYFRSKEEIFLAVVEKIADELTEAQFLEGIETAAPAEVLAATTRAYAEVIFTHGGLVGLIDVAASVNPEVEAIWGSVRRRTMRRFANYLNGLDSDLIDPAVAPERLVLMIADSIHYGAKRLVHSSPEEKQQFIADQILLTERLVGIGARPARDTHSEER